MHHVTRIVCCGALSLLLLVANGCGTVAKATGRFAVGTLTSGGSVTTGAQNAAVGAAIDVVTNPRGEAAENVVPKIVTVYSARRTARMTRAVGLCQIERGDETLESNYRTTLEPGDVLRFHKP